MMNQPIVNTWSLPDGVPAEKSCKVCGEQATIIVENWPPYMDVEVSPYCERHGRQVLLKIQDDIRSLRKSIVDGNDE